MNGLNNLKRNKMEKTAVEWLECKIDGVVNSMVQGNRLAVKKIIKQAKEMEKQQIEQAFNEGDLFSHNYDESGKKYYIYTFEK
jgi:hypothetical protein